MTILHLLSWFAGGAFAANAVPHFVSGVQGRRFQSPFAKPPGVGLSSARTNAVWGVLNLVAAWLLVLAVGDFDPRRPVHALAFGAGLLFSALAIAGYFGKLHGGTADGPDR